MTVSEGLFSAVRRRNKINLTGSLMLPGHPPTFALEQTGRQGSFLEAVLTFNAMASGSGAVNINLDFEDPDPTVLVIRLRDSSGSMVLIPITV